MAGLASLLQTPIKPVIKLVEQVALIKLEEQVALTK